MKRIFSLFITFLILITIPAFASEIEVQPTMISRSNAQDRVWVGTFQIVWNDFIDKYVHNYVRFREGTPESVFELNKRTFSEDDIADKSFYKYSGTITKNTKKNIEKAIKKKFDETSDILGKLDLTPAPNRFLIYVMLKKDFEFLNEFEKLGTSRFGNIDKAEYFGVSKHADAALRDSVDILFYNNMDDFAVLLKTKDNDEVILYKNASNKPFKEIYSDMNLKIAKYGSDKAMKKGDELKVPNIKFNAEKSFDELTNKRVMGTNILIQQAIETVKFEMNNKGVKLKSEAAMTLGLTCAAPDKSKPKLMYFDNTFVIFLRENGKRNPYFGMRVNDIKKFQ